MTPLRPTHDMSSEALLKPSLQAVEEKPGLIETLLWERGAGYALLDLHLARLAASADALDIPLPGGGAADALAAAAAGFVEPRQRVRLVASPAGEVSVTSSPLPAPAPQLRWRFSIAPQRMSSANPLLLHKTTARAIYDAPRQAAHERLGVDEVVFLNEREELTEGSFTTLFLRREGRLLTPHLLSGLLPGTLRAALLARGEVEEAVLGLDDLRQADEVLLGNSVRGLVHAQWIEPES